MYSSSLEDWYKKGMPMPKQSIEFKRLNGLTPTVESCTMKLLEEVGELMQLIGKGQGLSGETVYHKELSLADDMIAESLDVAQSAVTMAFTLTRKYGLPITEYTESHEKKLRERGYLK